MICTFNALEYTYSKKLSRLLRQHVAAEELVCRSRQSSSELLEQLCAELDALEHDELYADARYSHSLTTFLTIHSHVPQLTLTPTLTLTLTLIDPAMRHSLTWILGLWLA